MRPDQRSNRKRAQSQEEHSKNIVPSHNRLPGVFISEQYRYGSPSLSNPFVLSLVIRSLARMSRREKTLKFIHGKTQPISFNPYR